MKNMRIVCIGLVMLVVMGAAPAALAVAVDVDVYVEGAYSQDQLCIYIYADITPQILSYGVKLTYNTGELAVLSAEKNEGVWYMGDGTTNYVYMDPETDTAGEIVIIGGKLDTADPLAGVSGSRVLLGSVTFSRLDASLPFSPALGITYGRDGEYDNFVGTDGMVLDDVGVVFSGMDVVQRGDINQDGFIDGRDVRAFRMILGSSNLPCWCDCDANGVVDGRDLRCLRSLI